LICYYYMKHRSVETFRLGLSGWKGWNWFNSVIEKCNSEQEELVVGLLKTASRSNELNKLTKKMVDVDSYKDYIVIHNQPLEKQKKAIQLIGDDGKPMYDGMRRLYRYEHIAGDRTYAFLKKEKYSDVFLAIVDRTKNPDDLVFPYSYGQIYYRIATIGMDLEGDHKKNWAYHLSEDGFFPHEWRSIRACQLLRDYKYTGMQLRKFFGWAEGSPMPDHYIEMNVEDLMVAPELIPK
jgi:hypothetical protein